jgi:hypothetical protein
MKTDYNKRQMRIDPPQISGGIARIVISGPDGKEHDTKKISIPESVDAVEYVKSQLNIEMEDKPKAKKSDA